ncbi:MAG: hypothetical protein ACE5H4_11540 [Candidatus Thorarchaeota archaeon]
MIVVENFSDAIGEDDVSTLCDLLDQAICDNGWPAARDMLKTAFLARHQGQWFAINRLILKIIDAEELIGYDGDIIEELDTLQDVRSLTDLRTTLYDLLVERVRSQIASNGSLLFFDVDAMSSRPSSVLLAELLEARKKQFVDSATAFLSQRPSSAEWTESPPLWTTSYGLDLLVRLDSFNDDYFSEFPLTWIRQNLEPILSDLGVDEIAHTDEQGPTSEVLMSERMELLAVAIVSRFNNYPERLAWDEPWYIIFSSGHRDSFQFVLDVSSGAYRWMKEMVSEVFDDDDLKTLTQDIRASMLRGAVRALSFVGTTEAVELLGMLLAWEGTENALLYIQSMSYREYFHYRDSIQDCILDSLSKLDRETIQKHVIAFVNDQLWDVKKSKWSESAFLTGTSLELLKVATGMILRKNLYIISEKLMDLHKVGELNPDISGFAASVLKDFELE